MCFNEMTAVVPLPESSEHQTSGFGFSDSLNRGSGSRSQSPDGIIVRLAHARPDVVRLPKPASKGDDSLDRCPARASANLDAMT
jgi:hypothetical protein